MTGAVRDGGDISKENPASATKILWGQVVTVFLIVLAGVWGATQWTAAAKDDGVKLNPNWVRCLWDCNARRLCHSSDAEVSAAGENLFRRWKDGTTMARPHLEQSAMSADASAVDAMRHSTHRAASLIERLYRGHIGDLTRYVAARFGPGPPEPEDVAQAAFAKLATSGDVAELANPRGYLYTIACNIVIDYRRRSTRRDAVHRDISMQADAEELSESSPERVLLAKERFAVFEEVLRAMPKLRRRIFLLVRAEGYSPREVASRFGMKESAIHKHVSRALQDCAAAFEKAETQE